MSNISLAAVRGFQRMRIGKLLITAFYDGFVPVPADDLHGAPSAEIARLLTEAYMAPGGTRARQ